MGIIIVNWSFDWSLIKETKSSAKVNGDESSSAILPSSTNRQSPPSTRCIALLCQWFERYDLYFGAQCWRKSSNDNRFSERRENFFHENHDKNKNVSEKAKPESNGRRKLNLFFIQSWENYLRTISRLSLFLFCLNFHQRSFVLESNRRVRRRERAKNRQNAIEWNQEVRSVFSFLLSLSLSSQVSSKLNKKRKRVNDKSLRDIVSFTFKHQRWEIRINFLC